MNCGLFDILCKCMYACMHVSSCIDACYVATAINIGDINSVMKSYGINSA